MGRAHPPGQTARPAAGGEKEEGIGGDAARGRRLSREEVEGPWVNALRLVLTAGLALRRGGRSSCLCAVLRGVHAKVDAAIGVPGHVGKT